MIQLPNLTDAILILANLPHTLQNQNTYKQLRYISRKEIVSEFSEIIWLSVEL